MIPIISRPGAFNSPVISPIYINNPLSSIYHKIRVNFTRQRRRIQASPLVLPLLPFPIQQVLVPSEVKTIRLYEARYLALLEEVQPYLTGEVIPLIDNFSSETTEINSKVLELKDALFTLNSLEIKLKAPQEALLQTQSTNSLLWAEKNLNLDSTENFIPLMIERLSFVGLQPVSGNTQSEVQALQNAKLKAMDTQDTLERLDISMELVKNNIAMVAAKLAIQSLEVP